MDSGFTLIEMLISILIISLITTIIASNIYDEVQNANLETDTKQIMTTLETARGCSMANQDKSFVVFQSSSIKLTCPDMERNIIFDDLSITTNFPGNTAMFYQNGVINQGATINVCNKQFCKKMTIGVGRSDVQIK